MISLDYSYHRQLIHKGLGENYVDGVVARQGLKARGQVHLVAEDTAVVSTASTVDFDLGHH